MAGKSLTAARAFIQAWAASWWHTEAQVEAVALDYVAMAEAHPRAMADLSRFCCAHDSTFDAVSERQTLINEGKREVWLHIQAWADMTPADVAALKEETEE